MSKNTLMFCNDLAALKAKLKADGYYDENMDCYTVNTSMTKIIYNGNLSLSYVQDQELNLSEYTMLEDLGDYNEMFADKIKHDKYKSVYPYHIEQFYTDEKGNNVGYYLPKQMSGFY